MRTEAVLGFDPAPADPTALVALSDVLHLVARSLVEGRTRLDGLVLPGSVWEGAAAGSVAAVLHRASGELRRIEGSVIECRAAVDAWRTAAADRRTAVAGLVAEAAGAPDSEDGRSAVMARARAVQEDHEAGASRLVVAFEELSSTVERTSRSLGDLAADLDAALRALGAAVERWVDEDGPAVARTAVELGDVAGLTTVIAELVGVAALHRPPDEGAGVKAVAGRAPGAHRLVKALHRQWLDVAPEQLREASFAADHRATGLAESIAGRLAGDEPGGEGGVSRVAAR